MPEKTIDLVEYLHVQRERFSSIKTHLTGSANDSKWSISLRYSFLTFRIYGQSNEELYRWNWNMDNVTAPEVYYADKAMMDPLLDHMQPVSYATYKTIPSLVDGLFTNAVMSSLAIAESIAKEGFQCNAGDDYLPGYFSEILLRQEGIELNQINKWNSRSIDHKDDYTMRELHFFIPYNEDFKSPTEGSFQEESIGRMTLQFSDRSSSSNKSCGDRIRQRINFEALAFRK